VASGQLRAQPCRDIYGSHRFWDPTRKNNNPTFIASHIPQVRKLLLTVAVQDPNMALGIVVESREAADSEEDTSIVAV
jgi:hypothetical protein